MDNNLTSKKIDKEDFFNILQGYYSYKEKCDIELKYDFDITSNGIEYEPHLNVSYNKYINGKKKNIPLNDNDINEPLMVYAKNKGYEFISYKYYGNVRRVGYYSDIASVVFEGVILYLNKNKKRIRIK